MNLKFLALAFASVIIAGCSSPGAIVPMPAVPAEQVDTVRLNVVTQPTETLEDNVVQSRTFEIPLGSSVVIAVPDSQLTQRATNQASGDFRTDGFFNVAEQQIERSLLRNGFQVKDRSKFEAILRDQRDRRNREITGSLGTTGFDLRDFDPACHPILSQLEERFNRNAISGAEYARELEGLRAQCRVGAATRNRAEGEQELTDISEVIRAASASDVQADYVLQIHEFNTIRLREERVNLFNSNELRDFMTKYPELNSKFQQKQFFSCQSLEATLNAKLIHVRTGNVVWIGNHSVSELQDTQSAMELEFRYRRFAANADQIRAFVNQQNLPHVRDMRGDFVNIPPFQFREELIGPVQSGGSSCLVERRSTDEVNNTRIQLSRRVASELMGTIRVGNL